MLADFVGRRLELAALSDELRDAADEPRLVWVEGEPGVGKTAARPPSAAGSEQRAVWVSGDEEETALARPARDRRLALTAPGGAALGAAGSR